MSGFQYFGWHITPISGAILFIVGVFALLTIIRMFYTSHPKAPRYVPESTFLVFLGIGFGAIVSAISGTEAATLENLFKFSHDIFLFLLVPIIIFESAYTLDKSSFFHNFTEIMTYAVIGTLGNTLFIAFLLNLLKKYFVIQDYTTSQMFAFAALISAVDPVSVMAVMLDLKVNKNLYNMSFGESVLNDGVSIVLYTLFSNLDSLKHSQYNNLQIVGAGLLKFLISVVFAILIGASVTFLACLVLRYKKNKPRYLEPFMALVCAYGTFQLADSLLFSGIISIIISGLLLSRYSEPNWAHSSVEAMHVTMKMFASSFEALIFFDMGMQISFLTRDKIVGKSKIDYWFLFAALGLVLVARTLSVLILTALLNIKRKARNEYIPLKEQLIMIMAGLRGAISFALSTSLVVIPATATNDELTKLTNVQNNIIFVTCIIILFTIVIQGLPLGFFIKKLYISREREYSFDTPIDGHRIDLTILTTDLVFQQTVLAIDAIGWNRGMINSWSRFVQKFDGILQRAFLRKKITNEGQIMKKLMLIAEEEDKAGRAMEKEVDDMLLRKRKAALNEVQSLLSMGGEERAREILAELPPDERRLIAQKLNLRIAAPEAIDQQTVRNSVRFLNEFANKGLVSSESRRSFANSQLSLEGTRMPGAGIAAGIDGFAFGGSSAQEGLGGYPLHTIRSAAPPTESTPALAELPDTSVGTETSSEDSLSKYMPKSQSHVSLGPLTSEQKVTTLQPGISITSFSPTKTSLSGPRNSPPNSLTRTTATKPPEPPAPSVLTISKFIRRNQEDSPGKVPAAVSELDNTMGVSKDNHFKSVPMEEHSGDISSQHELDTIFFQQPVTFGDGNVEKSVSDSNFTLTSSSANL